MYTFGFIIIDIYIYIKIILYMCAANVGHIQGRPSDAPAKKCAQSSDFVLAI